MQIGLSSQVGFTECTLTSTFECALDLSTDSTWIGDWTSLDKMISDWTFLNKMIADGLTECLYSLIVVRGRRLQMDLLSASIPSLS